MRVCVLLAALLASTAAAFAPALVVSRSKNKRAVAPTALLSVKKNQDSLSKDTNNMDTDNNNNNMDLFQVASTSAVIWATMSTSALADSPDWGIFEGRTGSLLHPLTMASLLLFSLNTGYLGLQWRRQRTLGDEISTLKKSLPPLGEYSSVPEALDAAQGEDGDASKVPTLQAALATEQEIASLTAERKELASKGLRDKHYNQGALLAFVGTAFAIEGPLNTFARAGKLFPGPHLYAGAGIVVLWAAAAACVPFMQKGNDTARSLHIAANTVGVGLFGWQVVSGVPILLKVIEKTAWP